MRTGLLDQITADARLSVDLRPPAHPAPATGVALLTGATGFLGRQMLGQLLAQGQTTVVCLVRGSDAAQAKARLLAALREAELLPERTEDRIQIVCGDVAAPDLGLSAEDYAALSQQVDTVYHCAAEVNWVKGYRRLRQINVIGTLEVLRFCCAMRAKPLTFASSIAVCFATGAPAGLDETADMLPWIEGMPLGYAMSKCVAESLLRHAAAAGLPVTIVRAGLLAGDTKTGRANETDMVSALLETCVRMKEAPDADWLFDSIPVDYAARAIIGLSQARQSMLETFHLRHGKPRHWREILLWLNLLGYPMRFIPDEAWLARAFAPGNPDGRALSSYRRFFMGAGQTRRPFEVYIDSGRIALRADATRCRLAELGIAEPVLDADLLRLYVDHFIEAGLIPDCGARRTAQNRDDRDTGIKADVTRRFTQTAQSSPARLDWEPVPFDAANGVLNEIASIRLGTELGIRRYRVRSAAAQDGEELDLLVKAKPNGALMHALIAEIGTLEAPALGRNLGRFPGLLGLSGTHLRETALYAASSSGIQTHMPRCYGTSADAERGIWSVAIETLSSAAYIDDASGAHLWPADYRHAAIDGAAQVHASWYGRDRELLRQDWLGPQLGAAAAQDMSELWHALTEFSGPCFSAWTGQSLVALRTRFIDTIGQWWGELARLPQTLIHNDFNPRNLAFRKSATGPTLCAFDWELARIGVPQHDLAELLCFLLPEDADRDMLAHNIELHRSRLSTLTGAAIDPHDWVKGFVLALQQLSIERLPLYALVNRFKPQPFMPRVMRNWLRLYDMSLSLQGETTAPPAQRAYA